MGAKMGISNILDNVSLVNHLYTSTWATII